MKNKFLYIMLASVIVACSPSDKKAELEQLKKQQAANTAPVKVLTPFEKYKLYFGSSLKSV